MKKDTKANLEKLGWWPCKIANKMNLTLLDTLRKICNSEHLHTRPNTRRIGY